MQLSKLQKELVALAVISVVVITAGVLLWQRTQIHNAGRVRAVGIGFYWDRAATQNVTSIDWGMVDPGGTYGVTLFGKNIKNTAETLNLTVVNWIPLNAGLYLRPSWNYSGAVIQPSQVVPIEFRLQVLANVTGIDGFSFDYNVTAIEHK